MWKLKKNFWYYFLRTSLVFCLFFLFLFSLVAWIDDIFMFRVINMIVWGIYLLLVPIIVYIFLYAKLFTKYFMSTNLMTAQTVGFILFALLYLLVIVVDRITSNRSIEISTVSYEIPVSYFISFAYFNYILWKNERREKI